MEVMWRVLVFLVLVFVFVSLYLAFSGYKKDENEEFSIDYRCSKQPEIWKQQKEYVAPAESPSYDQKIPFKIFQTNEPKVLSGMSDALLSWSQMNPEYEYHYFPTNKCRQFIQQNFDQRVLNAYDKLIPTAFKADLFRYCVLYVHGGVYADSAMISLVPLKEILGRNAEFVSAVDGGVEGGIYNAFMCCTPNNPVIRRALDLAVIRIEQEDYGKRDLYITGPICLGDAFADILKSQRGKNFTPGPYEGGKFFLYHRYSKPGKKIGGIFDQNKREIVRTKYDCHVHEKSKWAKIPSYSVLWKERKVFK